MARSSSGRDTDALLARAISHHRAGELAEAERTYRKILRAEPGHADSLHLLGIVAHQRGDHDAAVDLISRAIAQRAAFAPFHYNLGLALAALGRAKDAAAQFETAITLNADYAEAHASLGDVLRDQGANESALAAYHRALAIKQSAEAHNKIGATLLTLGRTGEAIVHCEHAIAIKPDFPEAHANLARSHYTAGRAANATAFAMRTLELRETTEAKNLFVRCVRNLSPTGDVGRLRDFVLRGLTEPWGRPDELSAVAVSILKRDAAFGAAVARAAAEWPRHLSTEESTAPSLRQALSDPLLECLLEVVPVIDVALEHFLTSARRALLDLAGRAAPTDPMDDGMLRFFCALARQCFVNEYVFSCGEVEAAEAQRLCTVLDDALASDKPVSPLLPVAVAAYFPLASLSSAERLEARTWPDHVHGLLTQQNREPREEQRLRATIPAVTAIDDDISRKVRDMYEENPYPRWIKVAPAESPKPLDAWLRARFGAPTLREIVRKPSLDILIAGCGTGRQAVEMAQRFAGAKVLALDLSLASLAYAKRKTQELGLSNIEYGQADILRLGELDRSFDLIESSGVLHHLDDPWAGWRVLLALLRPGGFTRVGLYSELGRPGVIAGRALVAERGYRADADGIRQFRQEIMTGPHGPPLSDLVTKYRDFFTTSELRDLVFHVREHRMTIPQIAHFLRENALDFIGFEIDAQLAARYRARFPDDSAMTNLDHWHAFETEHLDAFYTTYQFWVRAPQ